jgi:hypothetical protein
LPTKRLYVAMLQYEIYDNYTYSRQDRTDFLIDKINTAYNRLHTGAPDSRVIFLAPEYFFARKQFTSSDFMDGQAPYNPGQGEGASDKKRAKIAYTQSSKNSLVDKLKRLTANRPDFLLVPGTIHWRNHFYFKKIRNQFRDDTLYNQVRNTAPVMANGDVILSYDKHVDAGELDYDRRLRVGNENFVKPAEKYRYVGGSTPGIFTLWGMRLGIEICGDTSSSILKTACGTDRVDVHILVSAGSGANIQSCATVPDGLLLHNDGATYHTSQQVYRTNAGPPRALVAEPEAGVVDGDIRTWTVDVNHVLRT